MPRSRHTNAPTRATRTRSPQQGAQQLKTDFPTKKPDKHSQQDARADHQEFAATLLPASIPFRAFKVALANMKDRGALPDRINHSVWTNQLFGRHLHDMIDSCRFLRLIDADARPTPLFRDLLDSLGAETWALELRRMLEAAYAPLFDCSMSSLTAGGLLHMFRKTYRTPSQLTRKCCTFFVHAGREAALDFGPFVLTNSRSLWAEGRRTDRRDITAPSQALDVSLTVIRDQALTELVAKFPAYDANWSEDVKRLWLSAFSELVQKFDDASV